MATTATQGVLDTTAAEFRLPATDGKTYALDDVAGEKGTVVVFICNHCPYVKAVIDRMVADARVLMSEGVRFAASFEQIAAKPTPSHISTRASANIRAIPPLTKGQRLQMKTTPLPFSPPTPSRD